MFLNFIYVAIGGAIGASARYATGLIVLRSMETTYPVATLSVNVIGSFIMGMFVNYGAIRDIGFLQPLVMVGILGGFTTFSTFSLDAVGFLERGRYWEMGGYMLLSVGLAIGAFIAGMALVKAIYS